MKTLLAPLAAIAVAGAVLASAASAQAAPRHNGHGLANHKHALAKKIKLRQLKRIHLRVCHARHRSVRREISRLRHEGYRHVQFQGRTFFRPRCALFINFKACHGISRYNVKVRYINGRNRYVISGRIGRCHDKLYSPGRHIPTTKLPNPRLKRFNHQG